MQRKKAVTTIELLITISIIGVMYLVLTPIMKNSTPNSSKVLLKKAYNTIEKTVYELINDDTAYSDPDLGFAYTTSVDGKNRFCYYFFNQLNTIELSADNCSGKTADGISYSISADFGTTSVAMKTVADPARKATITATEPKGKNFTATVDYDGKINVTGDIVNILKNPMDNK